MRGHITKRGKNSYACRLCCHRLGKMHDICQVFARTLRKITSGESSSAVCKPWRFQSLYP